MPPDRLSRLLMQKAAQNEQVLNILAAASNAPYEAMGFHAQQAIEKILYTSTLRQTSLISNCPAGAFAVMLQTQTDHKI